MAEKNHINFSLAKMQITLSEEITYMSSKEKLEFLDRLGNLIHEINSWYNNKIDSV